MAHSQNGRKTPRTISVRSVAMRELIFCFVFLFTSAHCSLDFEVEENKDPNTLVGILNFLNGELDGKCSTYFNISNGELRTSVKLDREEILEINQYGILVCSVTFMDGAGLAYETLRVTILDVNDNVPRFSELDQIHILNIAENFDIPNPVQRLQTVDMDNGGNGTVTFNITSGNEEGFFYIGLPLDYEGSDTNRQELFFNRTVDYETYKHFNLTITLRDNGTPKSFIFEQLIYINIIDINDLNPIFTITKYDFEVPENHPIGPENPFGNVSAQDPDLGMGNVIYSIHSITPDPDNAFEYIGLNNETGDIFLKQPIDFEQDFTLHSIAFDIQVQEDGRSEIDVAKVIVRIMDVNDIPPEINLYLGDRVRVENTHEESRIVLTASDQDGINGTYFVTLFPHVNYAKMNYFGYYSISISDAIDREQIPSIKVTLTVFDKGTPPLSNTYDFDIMVLDLNDNSPTFSQETYNAVVGESAPLGKTVLAIHASDPDFQENGTVSYTITSVNPVTVSHWFELDRHTGIISVNATLDYATAQQVILWIRASDNSSTPRTSDTSVNIAVSPAVTFKPRSYQNHSNVDFKIQELKTIYLEFRTNKKNGILLYEENALDELFLIEIENATVKCIHNTAYELSEYQFEGINISTNEWISVLYNAEQKMLQVWYTELEEVEERTEILKEAQLMRCNRMQSVDQTLFIGGINLFSQSVNSSSAADFVGIVRNVVIDSVQWDLSCPSQEENTVLGAVYPSRPTCGTASLTCSGPHYTSCLDYDVESRCVCAGGFGPESCKEEESYAPIQLSGASFLHLQLTDYSLFYDLESRRGLISSGPTVSRRDTTSSDDRYQLIEFQFQLLKNSTGILLYSRTATSVHTLEIVKQFSDYAWLYRVFQADMTTSPIYLTHTTCFDIRKVCTISINITTTDIALSINGATKIASWIGSAEPFVQYPRTTISLGGTDDPHIPMSNITGCISQFSVNGIEFPLNGLVASNDPSVKVSGNQSSGASIRCDLCQSEPSPCPASSQCTSDANNIKCVCPKGQVLNDAGDACATVPTTSKPTHVPSSNEVGETEPTEAVPFYVYIGGGVGVLVIIIALLVAIVLLVKFRKRKSLTKKQTYCVGEQQLPHLGNGQCQRSRPNSYATMTPHHSRTDSERSYITSPRHLCDSSMSSNTNNEHSDEDLESSNSKNIVRSKSSTSEETGFHTASERDTRSFPRMEDSGNEKETEYSPFDSESDDTSCVDTLTSARPNSESRSNGRAIGLPALSIASSLSSPPVSSCGAPLTPKEKKFITPLRPDSRSELDEETDLDTDFSSTILSKSCITRAYRASLKLKKPEGSDIAFSGQQWYKSSTASDNEREKKRAQGNRAYYPTHSEPLRLPQMKNVSPKQHNGISYNLRLQRKNSSPISHQQNQLHRPVQFTVTNSLSPTSRINNGFPYSHRTLPSSGSNSSYVKEKQREKESSEAEDLTPVLSRSQPLKMHYPYNLCRQSPLESPRVPPHLVPRSYVPYYMRSYSEESTRHNDGNNFVDLGSVRTNCDPIEYWEGQRRMKATVDQVDSYQVLSESFTHFEDSTGDTASMNDCQRQSCEEHQSFSSQGGGEATAEAIDLSLLQLRNCDGDSEISGTTLKGTDVGEKRSILHFPSADCSEEYRHTPSLPTLVACSGESDLTPVHDSLSIPPSEGAFEV